MELHYRQAVKHDIPALVQMLSDDKLGRMREDSSFPVNQAYLDAFESINQDPNNELVVVEDSAGMVGMLQLTFIPYLSHIGSWRCLIESVRIHSNYRGRGLGTDFFKWAIKRAADRGCTLVQLTSDKNRGEALRFYEKLGFKSTHEGFKLKL